MITNFEIHSFKDDACPKAKFEVYEFSELLEKLMLHSNAIVNPACKKSVDWNKNKRLLEIQNARVEKDDYGNLRKGKWC